VIQFKICNLEKFFHYKSWYEINLKGGGHLEISESTNFPSVNKLCFFFKFLFFGLFLFAQEISVEKEAGRNRKTSTMQMSTDPSSVLTTYNLPVKFASSGLNPRREAVVCVSCRLYFLFISLILFVFRKSNGCCLNN
jgi:hypothetical protein